MNRECWFPVLSADCIAVPLPFRYWRARAEKPSAQEANEYVAAMLLAVSMMFLRFMILILIFSREIFMSIYPYLLIMSVVAAVVAWFIHSRQRRSKDLSADSEEEDSSNPLEFKVALILPLSS